MDPVVAVARVAVHRGHVEAPPAPGYALAITGQLPVSGGSPAVEARVDGRTVARGSVAGAGAFAVVVDTLALPRRFVVEIEHGGERLATIEATRPPLPPAPADDATPLLVIALGRTGSSWLVHLLGAHPAALGYRSFELEPRPLGYWLGVLRALASVSSQWQLVARDRLDEQWWLGDGESRAALAYVDEEARAELGGRTVWEAATFVQRRIDAFNRAAARASGRERPPFFVEKWSPRELDRLGQVRELFPASRHVALVRDPRDMIASAVAYTARRGPGGFSRQLASSDRAWLCDVRDVALALNAHARATGTPVVRYEDLMLEPEPTLTTLLAQLGLDDRSDTVAAMLASASNDTPQMRDHRTAPSPRESIGRWRRDLSPELRDMSCEIFAPVLDELGYTAST